MKVKAGSEDELHIRIAQFLDKEYPHLLWTHVPNGEYRPIPTAIKLNAMGLKRGVPDLIFFGKVTYDGEEYIGMAVELKNSMGKLSDFQQMWRKRLLRRQWLFKEVRSVEEMRKLIEEVKFHELLQD